MKQQGRNKLPKEVGISLPPGIIRCIFGRHIAARRGLLEGQSSPNALCSLQANMVQTDWLRGIARPKHQAAFIPQNEHLHHSLAVWYELLLGLWCFCLEFPEEKVESWTRCISTAFQKASHPTALCCTTNLWESTEQERAQSKKHLYCNSNKKMFCRSTVQYWPCCVSRESQADCNVLCSCSRSAQSVHMMLPQDVHLLYEHAVLLLFRY